MKTGEIEIWMPILFAPISEVPVQQEILKTVLLQGMIM
jgi:hypothetical protein